MVFREVICYGVRGKTDLDIFTSFSSFHYSTSNMQWDDSATIDERFSLETLVPPLLSPFLDYPHLIL